jgi:hypothetical protein
MMSRPKESVVGIGTSLITAYNANQVRKLGKNFSSGIASLEKSNKEIISGIKNLAELQVATIAGLYSIHLEMKRLSQAQFELLEHFENIQLEKERLGNLKLFLRNVKKEVANIRSISEHYPVYATLMSENLVKSFKSTKVSIEDFKDLPMDEIDTAEQIMDSVDELYDALLNGLGD